MNEVRTELHARHCPDGRCRYNGIDTPGADCVSFDEKIDRLGRQERGAVQTMVAERIRAELVCCDIYERIQQTVAEMKRRGTSNPERAAIANAILHNEWHDLCYWGEASARIAEGRCPGYETRPNICRCGCMGCQYNCSAHEGEGVRDG